MITLIVCTNVLPKKALPEWEKVKGATVQFSTCTGLEESQVVVYKIPQGEFYGHVDRSRLNNIVVGSADELKMQTAMIFDVENNKYISEPRYRQYVSEYLQRVSLYKDVSLEQLRSEFDEMVADKHIPSHELERPLKIALMGTVKGPDLFDVMVGFGQKLMTQRLQTYLKNYNRKF